MAVFDFIRGLKVEINVDGVAVQEYDDNEEEDDDLVGAKQYQASRSVNKYVEAISGKNFEVVITVGPPYTFDCPTLMFEVIVDGKNVAQPLFESSTYNRTNSNPFPVSGVMIEEVGKDVLKPFKFSEIETNTCLSLQTPSR
jgi:hypothetical protein